MGNTKQAKPHRHQCEVCGEGFDGNPYYILGRKVCSPRCQTTVKNAYWDEQRARQKRQVIDADDYAAEMEAAAEAAAR